MKYAVDSPLIMCRVYNGGVGKLYCRLEKYFIIRVDLMTIKY